MRAPSGRRFAAGALAGVVAVFGVLSLRVYQGNDPALASMKASTPTSTSTTTTGSSSATTTDPYASGTTSSSAATSNSSNSVTATPGATTSAS
jgi:cytoskeletal protein RodZ